MPITPGTPLADTDLPAATADAQTNAAAIRTAIGAADAATNTGDETEGSILDKLKGAAADATRIGAEFLPDALEGAGDPNSSEAVAASVTLDPAGADNSVTFTSVTPGTDGNSITVALIVSEGAESSASPSVDGLDIIIYCGDLTTAQDVINDVNASPTASALVTASESGLATGLISSVTATNLTGGDDGVAIQPTHIGQLYRDTTNDVWYRATQLDPPVWEEDVGVTNANVNTAIAANVANTQIALGGGTAGRAVFGAADAAAARTTLGLANKSITKIVECECFTNTTPGAGEFTSVAINGGSCINSGLANANHPGVIAFRDAVTTANSGFRMTALSDSIIIGGGELAVSVFNLRSARSTQTVRFGIFDTTDNTTPTKGVWLEMVGNGTGVDITGKTVNGGAITSSGTTYTAAVSTWYSARIELTSASSATFTVYNESGTSLWTATIATAVPTGTTGFGIIAYDSSDDAATVMLGLDYLSFEINRTLTR